MDVYGSLERRLSDHTPLKLTDLADLALEGLDAGLFQAVVARVTREIEAGVRSARLFHILGLAQRELLDSAAAADAFERAALLAPEDTKIAHGLARSSWEAGLPATALYDRALRLAPKDANLLLGRAAALVAENRGQEAESGVARLLEEHPGWHEGHTAYARIVAAGRVPVDGTGTVRAALARYPDDASLWRVLLSLLLAARRYVEATEYARAAIARFGEDQEWRRAEAISLSEGGDPIAAQAVFDRFLDANSATALVHLLRNLIRLERFDEAAILAQQVPPDIEELVLFPYRALLWRLIGDERWYWLEGDERLIGVHEVDLSASQLDALAGMLRTLHSRSGAFTDQSVRCGTQTDGNLLARNEPELRALRTALLTALSDYIAQLPAPVARHPTLIARRMPVRIAGSWSVRLSQAGFHVDHVHPHGWLSSAFYAALPRSGVGQEGWLVFGECRELLPTFEGFRAIEPRLGRLVVFPSTMWHGTRRFSAGERISVAFDVARP